MDASPYPKLLCDSYLDILSPGLGEFHEWSPSADILDDWNPISDGSSQPEESIDSQIDKKNTTYSSVLKLSDIASALKGFSRTRVDPAPPRSCAQTGDSGKVYSRNDKDLGLEDVLEDVKPFAASCQPMHHSNPTTPKLCVTGRSTIPQARLDRQKRSVVQPELQEKSAIKNGLSQREIHIQSERKRRKSMRESFTTLQSLIPELQLKHTDRIAVLTEVISYIQSLRGTLGELERKKSDIIAVLVENESFLDFPTKHKLRNGVRLRDRLKSHDVPTKKRSKTQEKALAKDLSTVEVTVRFSGSDAFVTLNTPKRKGVWSGVLMLLQKYSLDVVNATLATSGDTNFHCIHAKIPNISKIESHDLQEMLHELILEELEKQL